MTTARPRVVIIGASGRAAAAAARDAGYAPIILDLFADIDTQALGPCRPLPMADYPDGFYALAASFPGLPIIYTGGLENSPELIAKFAHTRPVWGASETALRLVRDPGWLLRLLPDNTPALATTPIHVGDWLRKPCRGAGGMGITRYQLGKSFDPRTHYLQERIIGRIASAVCRSDANGTRVLLSSFQLIGTAWLHATEFAYAGNIGPIPTSPEVESIAQKIALEAKLRGVWGFDFILRESDARPMVHDVNPRFPASAELIALAGGAPVLSNYADCFADRASTPPAATTFPSGWFAKAVYYAPNDFTIEPPAFYEASDDPIRYADLPTVGTTIPAGMPVCTLLATGETEDACLDTLKDAALRLDRRCHEQHTKSEVRS